jgi:hypothetical protein
MIDLAISKGLIQKANTNDPAQKGRFIFIRKLFTDYLNKLNVPFYDPCCPAASTTNVPQVLSAAGAVDLVSKATIVTSIAAYAATLAAGFDGQTKLIKFKTDGGDVTLTPSALQGGTTITFNDAGDFVYLMFLDGKWNILTNSGATIA